METEVLMNWEDNAGNNFQLFKEINVADELVYVISSDAVDVSSWGGGCYYCVDVVSKLSEALSIFSRIVENAESANGIVDADWLIKTFGKSTC